MSGRYTEDGLNMEIERFGPQTTMNYTLDSDRIEKRLCRARAWLPLICRFLRAR